ncbi:hypothetical protein [Halomonas lysinitropha]|uniref:Uncharacterized protein n=1 Tax=Halomonas lysinitropha TaxID=2607506 RepID=A0A5K1I8V1_9GAMM|nr:hypothetical protein [Halomonas lysinitropha]VVZ96478.1 hypothetical protein HALO32_02578 [Halomonas lysinitropha]
MTETTPTANREALITETSRLAFEIEAAERAGRSIECAQLRVRFHTAMAELLALTTSWHPEGRAKVEWARRDHLRLAEEYQRELEGLAPTTGGERDV